VYIWKIVTTYQNNIHNPRGNNLPRRKNSIIEKMEHEL